MKEDLKAKVHRTEEALKAAHRGRNLPILRDTFSAGVMREIRSMGRSEEVWIPGDGVFETGTVWKFAGAALMLTMAVFVFFVAGGYSSVSIEMAEFASGDSSALILAHSLALI